MTEESSQEASRLTTHTSQQPLLPSTTGEPLILYDLATILGAVYQQPINLTKQGKISKRAASTLRGRLHGLPRKVGEGQDDVYVQMLFMVAQELGLIYYPSGSIPGDKRQFLPESNGELKSWSQSDESMQAKRFLQWWIQSPRWLDVYRKPPQQWWYASDWNPLAGRSVLVQHLRLCTPEQPYSISSLLDAIWAHDPLALRPGQSENRSSHLMLTGKGKRQLWDACDGEVYRSMLISTLYELGIVSLLPSTAPAGEASTVSETETFLLTRLGAKALSSKPLKAPSLERKHVSRMVLVQPSFEVLLLQLDLPTLYQLLPFLQVNLIERVSRLTLTHQSVLRGVERGIPIDQIHSILEKLSMKALPQNVSYTLHDWQKNYREIHVTWVLLLKVSTEDLADELCHSPYMQEFGLEKVAPHMMVAYEVDDLSALRQILKKARVDMRSDYDESF